MLAERRTETVRLSAGSVEYRWERRSDRTVIVFHGGHFRAGLAVGEDVFAANGYSVLVPSRPGYGRTPLTTGRTPGGFADVTTALCRELGIEEIAAVVGVSAGGRTAVAMAARHPDVVRRLVLESAVGFLPWPDRRTRIAGRVLFAPYVERATWGMVRLVMRFAPTLGLRALLGDLSTEPAGEVLAALGPGGRADLAELFSLLRSGHGFGNDLTVTRTIGRGRISQPTLVIASPYDGAVPIAHAESLVTNIADAELVRSPASSHLLWFGPDNGDVDDRLVRFLADDTVNSESG